MGRSALLVGLASVTLAVTAVAQSPRDSAGTWVAVGGAIPSVSASHGLSRRIALLMCACAWSSWVTRRGAAEGPVRNSVCGAIL